MSLWGVMGDGPWGRALAERLAESDNEVRIVGLKPSNRAWPEGVTHSTDPTGVIDASERLLVAVPVEQVEPLLDNLAPQLRGHHRVVTACRGLTPDRHLRASEAVGKLTCVRQIAVLAGVASAESLIQRKPAALVAASAMPSIAQELQAALTSTSLRVYTSRDSAGVELANTLATVMGVALGLVRARSMGTATEATVLTRSLAEMDRVVHAMGGQSGTAFGLAGLGALAGMLLDDDSFIHELARDLLADKESGTRHARDVAAAARTLAARTAQRAISAPIVAAIDAIHQKRTSVDAVIESLMTRATRAE